MHWMQDRLEGEIGHEFQLGKLQAFLTTMTKVFEASDGPGFTSVLMYILSISLKAMESVLLFPPYR